MMDEGEEKASHYRLALCGEAARRDISARCATRCPLCSCCGGVVERRRCRCTIAGIVSSREAGGGRTDASEPRTTDQGLDDSSSVAYDPPYAYKVKVVN